MLSGSEADRQHVRVAEEEADGWRGPAAPRSAAQCENGGAAAALSPKAAAAELSPPGQRQAGAAPPATSPLVDVSNLPALTSPSAQPPQASLPAYAAVTPTAQQHRGFPGIAHGNSPALTPPTAFRMSYPRFAPSEEANTFLEVCAPFVLSSAMMSLLVPSLPKHFPSFLEHDACLRSRELVGQRPEHTCLVLQEFVADLASDKATSSLAALPGIIPAIPLPLWHPHMQQVSLGFHSTPPLQESGDMG